MSSRQTIPGDQAQLRRCSHEFVADVSDIDTDLPHVGALHAAYRDQDVVIALHVGGRTTNLRWQEPSIERLIEVHSTHATSEWFMLEALERGYKMGVIAGSDGVDGRPGASHPGHMAVRNVRGGLTAFALPELTREALWTAMRERRCYATTGERILLEFECDGHPYGMSQIGLTSIIAPSGEIVAQSSTLGDELVIHECDLDESERYRGFLDFEQNRRPEFYRLIAQQADESG